MDFVQSTWKAWVAGILAILASYLTPDVIANISNDLGVTTATAVTALVAGVLTWLMTYLVPNKQ